MQGVSSRKVTAVMQEASAGWTCPVWMSAARVQSLDEEFQKWRARPLGEITLSLLLDARYEESPAFPVPVVSCALLVATGITPDGQRTILGVSVSLSEAEVHLAHDFLASLQTRGLHGVRLIVSDDTQGDQGCLAVASGFARRVLATLPVSPGQRTCWPTCRRTLLRKTRPWRRGCGRSSTPRIAAPEADRLLAMAIQEVPSRGAKLAAWLEGNVPEGLTVFDFPAEHRRRLRTNNMLERLNREIKRRTRVATLFPNEASLLRLATAVLMETDEEWQTEKRYLPKKNQ